MTGTSNRHWKNKEEACLLRSKGISIRTISSKLGIAKSTVSGWCKNVPLTDEQRRLLASQKGDFLKGIQSIQTHHQILREHAFSKGIEKYSHHRHDTNFVAGLMLYWAEGAKSHGTAAIANSDEHVIEFMIRWFDTYWSVDSQHMSLHMHLHSGQDERKEKLYWSKITGIPLRNFQKSFIKPEGSGYRKNILYHGTIKICAKCPGSSYILKSILGAIAAFVEDKLNHKATMDDWIDRLPHAQSIRP